jgi:hypothetical protein
MLDGDVVFVVALAVLDQFHHVTVIFLALASNSFLFL